MKSLTRGIIFSVDLLLRDVYPEASEILLKLTGISHRDPDDLAEIKDLMESGSITRKTVDLIKSLHPDVKVKGGEVDPNSPWAVEMGDRLCQTCSGEDRIRAIKSSNDRGWLSRVIAFEPRKTQKTVREAAKRRLRKLMTEGEQ